MKSLKALAILLPFFLIVKPSTGQNLIGYKMSDIRNYMKEHQKNMVFQGITFNNTFRYLKYADRSQMQTLFFFLSADSLCRSVRLVCDKSLKDKKMEELNAKYRKVGDNLWEEEKDGKRYAIDLKDENWTFNISINIKTINQ